MSTDPFSSIAAQINKDFSGEPGTFAIGQQRVHPDDGLITLTRGQYLASGRVSNFWYWTVEATGEEHHGYGDNWPLAVRVVTIDASSTYPDERTIHLADDQGDQVATMLCGMDPDAENVTYSLHTIRPDLRHTVCAGCAVALDEDAVVSGSHTKMFNRPTLVAAPPITLRSLGL